MQTNKILITGGAGFLGINLVRHLFNKGCSDIVILDIANFDYPEKNKVKIVKGDIRDKRAIEMALKGVDLVVHAAAALPLYKKRDIFSTDIDGTRNMLLAGRDHGVKRFVHVSSTAVYGIPDHHPLLETDKLEGVGNYGKAKIEAEQVCLEFRKKGMIVPILRPKSFIGPERLGVFTLLFDWAKGGKNFPMLGSGKNRYQLLDVEDLCEAIYICLFGEEEKVNDTFNIGAENFTTMREDWQVVLDMAGFGKKIIPFPALPAILTLRILEFFHLSPLYKWVYETASKDSFVSIEKAKEKLGFIPRYSNKQALLRNYKWYLENIEHFENVAGVSHRVPWKQGFLKIIKIFF